MKIINMAKIEFDPRYEYYHVYEIWQGQSCLHESLARGAKTAFRAKVFAWEFVGARRVTLKRCPRPDARPFTIPPNVVPVGLVVIIPKPVQRCYVLTEAGRAVASEAGV